MTPERRKEIEEFVHRMMSLPMPEKYYPMVNDLLAYVKELEQAKKKEERLFPIMNSYERRRKKPELRGTIPWALIAPHEEQAMRNHGGQTLEVLAQRGGLAPCEAVAVIEDRCWTPIDESTAEVLLEDHVTKWGGVILKNQLAEARAKAFEEAEKAVEEIMDALRTQKERSYDEMKELIRYEIAGVMRSLEAIRKAAGK